MALSDRFITNNIKRKRYCNTIDNLSTAKIDIGSFIYYNDGYIITFSGYSRPRERRKKCGRRQW